MATNIFKFDGTLLTTVADGTIDTTHSTIKFPGTGYQNYGEAVLEDILWTMQNFAGVSQPSLPLKGQTWYDTNAGLLKIYNGTTWVAVGNVVVTPVQPTVTLSPGSFWYDTVNLQLNVWNGVKFDIVGPLGSAVNTDPVGNSSIPTFSRLEAVRLSDATTATHQAWRMVVGGTVVCIVSKDAAYTPSPAITGFTTINPGINLNTSITNVAFTGDTTLFRSTQDNLPDTAGTRNLGSSALPFAGVYSTNGIFNNKLLVNTTTSPYNFQVNGSSYFNGPMTLAPGTTSSAPFTLTTGTLATTPVLGALEFDGSILYMTVLKNGVPDREQVGVGLQPPVGSWGFALTGTENAIVATSIPAQPAIPVTGCTFIGIIAATNTSTTVTLVTNTSTSNQVFLSDGASVPPIGSLIAGHAVLFYWNGAHWLALLDLTDSVIIGHPELGFLPLAGGTLTGPLILASNPTIPLQAVPKQYVDAADASLQSEIDTINGDISNINSIIDNLSYLPLAGGTMTGFPVLPGNPSSALQAAPKQYVDQSVQNYLPLSGGNMSGFPSLPGNPSLSLQATPKQYVDAAVSNVSNALNGYLPLAGGGMSGFPYLPGNPTNGLAAVPKQYVDGIAANYLPLSGGGMSGFPVLPGNPNQNLQAAPKQYVDSAVQNTGLVLLNTLVANNSAALVDTTSLTPAYRFYEILVVNMQPTTTFVEFVTQFQVGGTFQTNNYNSISSIADANGTGRETENYGVGVGNGRCTPSYGGMNARFILISPSDTTSFKSMYGTYASWDSVYNYIVTGAHGARYTGSSGAITGLQFFFSSGNMQAGQVYIYGRN